MRKNNIKLVQNEIRFTAKPCLSESDNSSKLGLLSYSYTEKLPRAHIKCQESLGITFWLKFLQNTDKILRIIRRFLESGKYTYTLHLHPLKQNV